MKTSLYTATIPPFIKALGNLSAILDKAVIYAGEKSIPAETLLNSQLAPDQFSLMRQVQLACDQAKSFPARINSQEPVSLSDNDKTVEDLKHHIDRTIEILMTVKPEDIDGKEDTAEVVLPYMPGKKLNGFSFAFELAVPNFYFHIVTAYAILRHNGMDLGKADYIGGLPLMEHIQEA